MRYLNIHILIFSTLLFFSNANTDDREVSVFYYPWYDFNRHWQEGYLRSLLIPAQLPYLGEYSNKDNTVINQHLDWSEIYGIDNWICSWWGAGSFEDITIKDYISPRMAGRNVTYCLFYESAGLLNLQEGEIFFDSNKINLFRAHFDYIADAYFADPNYLKIDGRPVVYLYLTRTFSGAYAEAIQYVRQDMSALGHEVFLIGDEVYWGKPNTARISTLDAITAYNMHGPSQYSGYPSQTNFIEDVSMKYAEYQNAARSQDVKLIPKIMPGFNDRGVRLAADHYVISTQFHPDSSFTSTLSHFADMAENYIDDTINAVCITSFNEWHEDTQIEPTIETESTSEDQSGIKDYTQNYFYKGYGVDFLEIIAAKFSAFNPNGIFTYKDYPNKFTLYQNYPNPFNNTTIISYTIPDLSIVNLSIYDVTQQIVEVLVSEKQSANNYRVKWDASKHASGIYFYKLSAGSLTSVRKLLLIK